MWNKKLVIYLSWGIVFLWMGTIFLLSAQPAQQSAGLSNGITATVIETIEKIIPDLSVNQDAFNHLVRKNAHFFAYFLLGVLTLNAIQRSGIHGLKSASLALGICILYAITDEIHQLFVPGRSGEIRDVLIDSAGAFVGIGVYRLINWRWR
ncbi:VanZ family protein [Sutcliffiella halmapala]|uniref:VanZ family protein n=1 Tax=Sutcliffiella halmapala TaxID=79882 RepID=UPI000995423B|nr:VanZ family protein [Sutcliffiella halmapala]